MPGLIPEEIQRFIDDHISSIAELEALLFLRDHSDRSWTCANVADRIYSSETVAAAVLVKLANRGILTGNATTSLFRYAPCTQDVARVIDQLAEVYAKYLVPMTDLIHKQSRRNIEGLSDAFKFTKER